MANETWWNGISQFARRFCTVGSGSFWPFFAFDLGGPGPISAYGTSQGQKMRVHSVVWCWLHLVTMLHCLWDYNMFVSFWNLFCTLVCRVDSSNRVGSVAIAPFYLLLHPQKRMFASLCHPHSVWLTNVASRPQGVPSSTLFRLHQLYQEDMTYISVRLQGNVYIENSSVAEGPGISQCHSMQMKQSFKDPRF